MPQTTRDRQDIQASVDQHACVGIPPPKQPTGNGQTIDDGIPDSLRRAPAKAKQLDLTEVDDDLNDEINI